MNKYTELSDFEINKKVADLIGATPFPFGTTEYRRSAVSGCESSIIIRSPRKVGSFNPCNNPSDAMPIIIENKLTLSPRYDSDEWISESIFYHDIYSVNKNPLRACMEVFLMMKVKEIEND